MLTFARIWHFAVSEGVPRRSLAVALIVGTILNLINQGDVLLGTAKLNLLKLVLTYAVPYCVSTYGAVSYRMSLGHSSTRGAPARSWMSTDVGRTENPASRSDRK